MATPGSSQRHGGNKKKHQDSDKTKSNLSGLKHALHGTSYQLKLGIVVSLANAKKTLVSTEKFSFTVTAEDPTAGKFDDIVYAFQHGDKTGTLKIQSKHKLSLSSCKSEVQQGNISATEIQMEHKQESSIPKITLNDLIADSKNDFFIQQYFKSFCVQPQGTIKKDVEGLIICTNADLDDDAKVMWNEIDPAVLSDTTTCLDYYISSLFDKAGGKCYQLKTHHKRAALARLLINAIKSKEQMVTWQRPLFKEYRAAILDIIDKDSISGNIPSFKFTDNFLNPTYSNSKPGYEAFRKEFEDQYREEFQIKGCVWDDLKLKRVHVSKLFLLDEKNHYSSSDSFSDDNVDESFKSFCDRFRLVCGTYNEQGLDEAIVKIRKNWYFENNQLVSNRLRVEENMVTEKLFKTYFNWLMDPFAKPLHSDDIKKDLENIEGILAYMKLEPISDKLRKKHVGAPFRIRHEVIKASELYRQVETKIIHAVETFDIQFGITLLLDVLTLQTKAHTTALFLNDSDFNTNEDIVESALRCIDFPSCLIVICHKGFKAVQSIVKKWEKDFLRGTAKQVFLISNKSNVSSDLSRLCLSNLTEQSWNQFCDEEISLCTTTILPSKIFQNNFQDLPIVQVFKCLDWGKQMEENNEISKKYHEIKSTYVHRPWIDEESNLQAENRWWNEDSDVYKSIKEPQQEGMSLNEITKRFKLEPDFHQMFGKANNPEEKHEPIVGNEGKKVLILLGEAGHGKSTNITWLAWHLRKRIPSSWVVRCNLSDHCSDFTPFTLGPKVIDETEALRMLYKLLRSSLQLDRELAEKRSKYLVLSDGEAIISEDLTLNHGLPLNSAIQLLVFNEKFNAGELVLLLDGFDEIAPHYKEVVLKFLSLFELFKGIGKIYLTSRPYGFKEQFGKAFKDSSFSKLKPLSLRDKGSILFKMMNVKWNDGNTNNEEVSDFYKSLCLMLLDSLDDMSDVPLNLMMVVDILGDRVFHNENIYLQLSSKAFKIKMFETILQISKASFTVEEFVKVKIRHLLYDKNGGDKNVADKPEEIERFEKAIDEVKLLHGLVALWVLFSEFERKIILSANEIREGQDYMKKIHEGSEKTGIIHSMGDGSLGFIHRTFVEYLAAWWIVKRRVEVNQQYRKKLVCLESFWERKVLRENIDTILAKCHPLHLAIIERNWKKVESLISSNPNLLHEKDDGQRTPLHLIASCYDFEKDWPHFLSNSIETKMINAKEKVFGWTALDFAFYREKPRLVYYLLHQGATINIKVLYHQIDLTKYDKVDKAAKYVKYVMEYLSSKAIEYESQEACKTMKKFCAEVMSDRINQTSHRKFSKNLVSIESFSYGEQIILKNVIRYDSVWMLQSVIQAFEKYSFRRIRNSYFDLALKKNSFLVVKYLMGEDSSILHDKHLWKCAVYAALNDYKIEFKYFVDLYCSRFKIKDFQTCSIGSGDPDYFILYINSDKIDKVYAIINTINWKKMRILAGIVIDANILSLLVICVATVRPSMLRYLIESCKLNLSAGTIFPLAMITNHLFSKLNRETVINPSKAYECLLDLPLNISDIDANKMLRLAITSNLFQFSKCLIERYNIDFQTVDESKGWNIFHLCASNQRSLWIEEMTSLNTRAEVNGNKTDLFRYMLAKASDMDCFSILDKKGRSFLHLAMENEQKEIVELIVARKLGLNNFKEIRNLTVVAIPNIIFCIHVIHEKSKCVKKIRWHYQILCTMAKQIVKISLTIDKQSQESNRCRLLLQENAKKLYEIATKCRSLFLMYYLHREFPDAIPPPIYDADWLAFTVDSLRSPLFLGVTKWLLKPTEVRPNRGTDEHANLYEIVENCDAEGYDLTSVDLEKLINQVETILSANRSVKEVCKLKLLALAVSLKNGSMITHLCEALNINIDWKFLIDIMVIAHQSYIDEPGTKQSDGCAFEKLDFDSIFKYFLERITEIDAEGANVLHLAAQKGLGCMAKFLIKHNMVDFMTHNEQNGWNIFHYYASSSRWKCCYTENDDLLTYIIKRVLEITSDGFPLSSLTESHKNKLKELCFNSYEGRKSVIHVAVEAGNIGTAEYIIECCLGIGFIGKHEIKDSDECARFRECYDEVYQIAAQFPFNGYFDYLLHKLTTSIRRFSPENIEHLKGQDNVEDHIVGHAIQSAIKYRSVTTLEHLMIEYEDQMNQALARSTNNELIACMTECIRRNRTNIFKVIVGHYRNLQGIEPSMVVEFENEVNDNIYAATIDENEIQWRIIDKFAQDVTMNRDYLHLLILSVAYARLSKTRFLVEMLQLEVNKSLLQLFMKVLEKLWNDNCNTTTPVYEYLANRCEGKPNLLHLCIQAECYDMLYYLIKEKKLDSHEIDSENGWNAGHYFVSDPNRNSCYKEFTWLVEAYNLDCFGVYDRNDRSILHLAIENDHSSVVKYILSRRLGLNGNNQPWYELDLEKIEKHTNELQQILETLLENISQEKQQDIQVILEKVTDRKIALTLYKQLFKKEP